MKGLTKKQNDIMKDLINLSNKLEVARTSFEKQLKLLRTNENDIKIKEALSKYNNIMKEYLRMLDKFLATQKQENVND